MKNAAEFLSRTTLSQLLPIPADFFEDCAAKAYEMLVEGDAERAELLARGLVAADHRHWYPRTLLAVALQKLGRRAEALEVVDEGLSIAPAHPELVQLRAALSPASATS